MAGRLKNIGAFRDAITVKYLASQNKDALGGKVATYTDYCIFADVRQIRSGEAFRLGLDALNSSYRVVCRPPSNAKPYYVEYNGESYKVISVMIDKVKQFAELIITKDV